MSEKGADSMDQYGVSSVSGRSSRWNGAEVGVGRRSEAGTERGGVVVKVA